MNVAGGDPELFGMTPIENSKGLDAQEVSQ